MTIRRSALIATAAFTGAAMLLTAPAALAQTNTRPTRSAGDRRSAAIDEVRARCLRAIDGRQSALTSAKSRVAGAKVLSDAHKAALTGKIDAAASGLSQLADKIQSESSFEQLRVECGQIVTDYRVFVLVLPRTRLVAASDAELSIAQRLSGVADKLQSDIDKAKADGHDTAKAQSDLDHMRAAITAGHDHAAGVYDSIINLTPADYNANHDVLTPARASVRSGHDSLRDAVAAGRMVRVDLKAANTTPTTAAA